MTLYAVDIRKMLAQRVTDDYDQTLESMVSEDRMRFYKAYADSAEAAIESAIALAKAKLASWNRTLDEYYKPGNGLPQNTGTIALMIRQIDRLRSLLGENHD